jgi:hypothetical protein
MILAVFLIPGLLISIYKNILKSMIIILMVGFQFIKKYLKLLQDLKENVKIKTGHWSEIRILLIHLQCKY